jgi:hypothetical protein
MKALKVLKYVGFAILGIGFCLLVIWGVQALWNSLIPNLFHGPVLSYWQTAGLFLLSKILLTGVAPGSHSNNSGREWRRKYSGKYRHDCKSEGQEPVAGATA